MQQLQKYAPKRYQDAELEFYVHLAAAAEDARQRYAGGAAEFVCGMCGVCCPAPPASAAPDAVPAPCGE